MRVLGLLLLALGLGATVWYFLPTTDERLSANEAYQALCMHNASEVSPRAHALCEELHQQLQFSAFRVPWKLLRDTSSVAATACAPLTIMQDTDDCRTLDHQVNKISTDTLRRVFPAAAPLSGQDARELYQTICGQGQADASGETNKSCKDLSDMISRIGQRDVLSEKEYISNGLLSLSLTQAARSISDVCWPREAQWPSSNPACQAVQWTWVGSDKSRCIPDLSPLQSRNLTAREQIIAATRYMNQPSLCFW